MAPKQEWTHVAIKLDGKLVTSDDPSTIGKNFKALTNMRYTDTHPKMIGGMTKINTATPAN